MTHSSFISPHCLRSPKSAPTFSRNNAPCSAPPFKYTIRKSLKLRSYLSDFLVHTVQSLSIPYSPQLVESPGRLLPFAISRNVFIYKRLCPYNGMDSRRMVMDILGRNGDALRAVSKELLIFQPSKVASFPFPNNSHVSHNLLTRLTSLVLHCVAVSINRRKISSALYDSSQASLGVSALCS